jgi:hypothetical protein
MDKFKQNASNSTELSVLKARLSDVATAAQKIIHSLSVNLKHSAQCCMRFYTTQQILL